MKNLERGVYTFLGDIHPQEKVTPEQWRHAKATLDRDEQITLEQSRRMALRYLDTDKRNSPEAPSELAYWMKVFFETAGAAFARAGQPLPLAELLREEQAASQA